MRTVRAPGTKSVVWDKRRDDADLGAESVPAFQRGQSGNETSCG